MAAKSTSEWLNEIGGRTVEGKNIEAKEKPNFVQELLDARVSWPLSYFCPGITTNFWGTGGKAPGGYLEGPGPPSGEV